MSSASTHSGQEKAVEARKEEAICTTASDDDAPLLTPEEEKKLIRRIDYRLVPFLSLLYLLSFLDRVNIGQARLDGLEADLGLVGNQYQATLVIFFVGYVVTEVPSNMLLKRIRPSRLIPAVMLAWGLVMTLMCLVKNYAGLLAARFFLGLAESPLFPNIRIAIFFSSATLSGAFGGILAYGLGQADGVGGLPGWAHIFLWEGLLTFLVALAAPFMIEDFPEDAKMLSPVERKFIIKRLADDIGTSGEFRWVHVKNAFKDWRVYIMMLIYIGVAEPLYSLALFTPTIISELGTFNRWQSQLLSTPPYFLAFIITLASALYSDRVKRRGWFNVFWMSIVVIGYAILLGNDPREKPGVSYFALFLCVAGVAPAIPMTIVWTGNNLSPTLKRGTGMGMMFTLGNSGGIISSLVYFTEDRPRYYRGHGVGLAFAAMAVVLSLFMTLYLSWENKRRDRLYGTKTEDLHGPLGAELQSKILSDVEVRRKFGLENWTPEQIEEAGDRLEPIFRYYP
ncbi:hypothetical protein Rhopal_001946-T1 [Rhodotorula paludigena]|uniref:Uncharacterized protein n=1 Tax=Rhodotorula paludigena TaxID=86838 RepID=A0AAV5GGV1_9BASI|nr:hypothetical protein Rhopal_001946-T1 [Rhodotorula paludigena]